MNAINQKEPPATAFSEHNAYSRGTRSGRIYGRVVRIFVAASIELLKIGGTGAFQVFISGKCGRDGARIAIQKFLIYFIVVNCEMRSN
jgi:hypothetical protein